MPLKKQLVGFIVVISTSSFVLFYNKIWHLWHSGLIVRVETAKSWRYIAIYMIPIEFGFKRQHGAVDGS
jgi:hypothetical protein